MPRMIEYDDTLIRINDKGTLDYSKNGGRSWNVLYAHASSYGEFIDLLENDDDDEILAITSKGLYFSRSGGRTWNTRNTTTSKQIEFYSLKWNGDELLADTEDGLYYSRNAGHTWSLRHR